MNDWIFRALFVVCIVVGGILVLDSIAALLGWIAAGNAC